MYKAAHRFVSKSRILITALVVMSSFFGVFALSSQVLNKQNPPQRALAYSNGGGLCDGFGGDDDLSKHPTFDVSNGNRTCVDNNINIRVRTVNAESSSNKTAPITYSFGAPGSNTRIDGVSVGASGAANSTSTAFDITDISNQSLAQTVTLTAPATIQYSPGFNSEFVMWLGCPNSSNAQRPGAHDMYLTCTLDYRGSFQDGNVIPQYEVTAVYGYYFNPDIITEWYDPSIADVNQERPIRCNPGLGCGAWKNTDWGLFNSVRNNARTTTDLWAPDFYYINNDEFVQRQFCLASGWSWSGGGAETTAYPNFDSDRGRLFQRSCNVRVVDPRARFARANDFDTVSFRDGMRYNQQKVTVRSSVNGSSIDGNPFITSTNLPGAPNLTTDNSVGNNAYVYPTFAYLNTTDANQHRNNTLQISNYTIQQLSKSNASNGYTINWNFAGWKNCPKIIGGSSETCNLDFRNSGPSSTYVGAAATYGFYMDSGSVGGSLNASGGYITDSNAYFVYGTRDNYAFCITGGPICGTANANTYSAPAISITAAFAPSCDLDSSTPAIPDCIAQCDYTAGNATIDCKPFNTVIGDRATNPGLDCRIQGTPNDGNDGIRGDCPGPIPANDTIPGDTIPDFVNTTCDYNTGALTDCDPEAATSSGAFCDNVYIGAGQNDNGLPDCPNGVDTVPCPDASYVINTIPNPVYPVGSGQLNQNGRCTQTIPGTGLIPNTTHTRFVCSVDQDYVGGSCKIALPGRTPTSTRYLNNCAPGTVFIGNTFNCLFSFANGATATNSYIPPEGLFGLVDDNPSTTPGTVNTGIGNSTGCTIVSGGLQCNAIPTSSGTVGIKTNGIVIHRPAIYYYTSYGSVTLTINTDNTPPAITSVTSTTADGAYNVGDTVSVTVNLSESSTITSALGLTFNTGGTCGIAITAVPATSFSCTYTIAGGENAADLTVSSVSGTIADLATNVATNPVIPIGQNLGDSKNIIVDNVAPVAQVYTMSAVVSGPVQTKDFLAIPALVTDNASGVSNVGFVLSSTPATGTLVGTIAMSPSGVLTYTPPTTLVAPTVFTYTYASADGAGNLSNNGVITINVGYLNPPIITSATSTTADGSYTVGNTVSVAINLSEPASITSALGITFNTGGTCGIPITATAATSFSCTYTVSGGENTADLAITSVTGTIADVTNNLTVNPTVPSGQNINDTKNIIIDTIAPVAQPYTVNTVISGTTQSRDFLAVPTLVTDTASSISTTGFVLSAGAASGTSVGTIALSPAGVLTYTPPLILPSATSFTYTYAARDSAGNLSNNGVITVNVAFADVIPPTITAITSFVANGTYGVGQAIPIVITFSEAVTVTTALSLNLSSNTTCIIPVTTIASTTATCNYVVASPENTTDLTINTLTGAIADTANNSVTTLTIPSGQNLGDLKNIAIVTASDTIPGNGIPDPKLVCDYITGNTVTDCKTTGATANCDYQSDNGIPDCSAQQPVTDTISGNGIPDPFDLCGYGYAGKPDCVPAPLPNSNCDTIADNGIADCPNPPSYTGSARDTDIDGIADVIENSGPNSGDTNNNGVLDSLEANVATGVSSTGQKAFSITLSNFTSGTCQRITTTLVKNEVDQILADNLYSYPFGLVSFELNACTRATVTIDWYTGDTTAYTLRKLAYTTPGTSSTATYLTLTNTQSAITQFGIQGMRTVYLVEDGKVGDLTAIDGKIIDPVGLATNGVTAPGLPRTGLVGFGVMSAVLLLVVSGVVLYNAAIHTGKFRKIN
jgi:hypothetical protein